MDKQVTDVKKKIEDTEKLLADQYVGFRDAFDQFLYEFPVQHLGLLSQTSVLILIRELIAYTDRARIDLKGNRHLQTSGKIVKHLLLKGPLAERKPTS